MKTFAAKLGVRKLSPFVLGACLLGIAACSSLLEPRPDPSRFYLLTPQPSAGQVSPASTGARMSLGLGPVTMPAYLDRPQTVTRIGTNELRVSEIDRWAEPLNKNFAHVLGQDLEARLGAHVHEFPWYNSTAIDYQVEVAVHRFETDASGQSLLAAHWTILDGRNNQRLLDSGDTTIAQSSAPADAAASTAALSRTIGAFSDQIASTLRQLAESRQARAEERRR